MRLSLSSIFCWRDSSSGRRVRVSRRWFTSRSSRISADEPLSHGRIARPCRHPSYITLRDPIYESLPFPNRQVAFHRDMSAPAVGSLPLCVPNPPQPCPEDLRGCLPLTTHNELMAVSLTVTLSKGQRGEDTLAAR
jgi:hypothetical protein